MKIKAVQVAASLAVADRAAARGRLRIADGAHCSRLSGSAPSLFRADHHFGWCCKALFCSLGFDAR